MTDKEFKLEINKLKKNFSLDKFVELWTRVTFDNISKNFFNRLYGVKN